MKNDGLFDPMDTESEGWIRVIDSRDEGWKSDDVYVSPDGKHVMFVCNDEYAAVQTYDEYMSIQGRIRAKLREIRGTPG